MSMSRAAMPTASTQHYTLKRPLLGPYPPGTQSIAFGMGCFWCSEALFLHKHPGVAISAVGYTGGTSANPTYRDICSGTTGHAEVTLIVYDPAAVDLRALLKTFWEGHNPTTPNQQGGDRGTQYRSAVFFTTPEQEAAARASGAAYGESLKAAGVAAPISTQIVRMGQFHYAEERHQQFDFKPNARQYCGLSPVLRARLPDSW